MDASSVKREPEETRSKMVVTTGLPLVMVHGRFSNLNKMDVSDLELFLPFLTTCSFKLQNTMLSLKSRRPDWWVPRIDFSFPLKQPEGVSITTYRRYLIAIAFNCYFHHKMDYIVHFCAHITRNPNLVYSIENGDGTTSLYRTQNDLHILTFSNENMNYEQTQDCLKYLQNFLNNRSKEVVSDNNKCSLVYLCDHCDADFSSQSDFTAHEQHCPPPSKPPSPLEVTPSKKRQFSRMRVKLRKAPASPRRQLMPVQKVPTIFDVYLCENCDSEFATQQEINAHELQCYGSQESSTDVESKPADSWDLFGYLRIAPKFDDKASVEPVAKTTDKSSANTALCLLKNRSVEFSSLLGQRLLNLQSKRDSVVNATRSVQQYDQYCLPPSSLLRKPRDSYNFRISFKSAARHDRHCHFYSYSRADRRERFKTLQTGLNRKSRLLLRQCKPCHVSLVRTCTKIDEPPSIKKSIIFIDLCDDSDEL